MLRPPGKSRAEAARLSRLKVYAACTQMTADKLAVVRPSLSIYLELAVCDHPSEVPRVRGSQGHGAVHKTSRILLLSALSRTLDTCDVQMRGMDKLLLARIAEIRPTRMLSV